MDPVHLHLLVNHVPILGTAFVLALLLWGWARHSRDVLRTAFLATVLLGAVGYGVMLTGEPAEEAVEDLAWADRRAIHAHEENGELAAWAGVATGVLGLAALVLGRGARPPRAPLTLLVAVGLTASMVLYARAGLSGGDIRHDELRGRGVPTPPTVPPQPVGPTAS